MFQLPIEDPVKIFALTMIIFFLTPILMNKLRIPGIIGPIIAGIIIGPNGLNILERDQTIVLLGTVGLLFIIFIAGLELDLDGFKKYKHRSITFGALSFVMPFVLGTLFSILLGYSIMASILIGSIVGSHTLLGYPIASRLGIAKNKAVTTAVGGTLITDTSALLVLAVVTGAVYGALSTGFWLQLTFSIIVFVSVVLVGIPFLSRWFFRNINSDGIKDFTFVMVILFLSGFLALIAGLEPIIGAFLAGLALNRLILEYGPLMNRIRFFGNALFIPFFLLSVGMLMDLGVLISDPGALLVTLLILLAVFMGKGLAPIVAGKLYNYSKVEMKVMFGLTIPQAAATLAATLVGFNVGLLDQSTVNAVIIMILASCIIGPSFVDKYGRQLALTEEEKPYKAQEGPERILIPLSDPTTMESLLDLAFLINQGKKQEEAIYPLSVVQKEGKGAEKGVARAEKMLGNAVMYASGADVQVRMLTRVDLNVSDGIVRAVTEERINIIVAGWDAQMTSKQLFGSVIDRVIDRTNETILVSKIGTPLNTVKRVVLVIANGATRKAGFRNALKKIKLITSKLNVTLLVLVVKEETELYVNYMKTIKPNPPTTLMQVESWDLLNKEFIMKLSNDELVIILSARKGTIGWHSRLEKLPEKLVQRDCDNFIIYYPAEAEEEVDIRGTRGTELPKTFLYK